MRWLNLNDLHRISLKITFHTLASNPPYLCDRGQGEAGKAIKSIQACHMVACENECTKDSRCKGFDYTSKVCTKDTCQLYPTNTPRITTPGYDDQGGADQRSYCSKVERKLYIF